MKRLVAFVLAAAACGSSPAPRTPAPVDTSTPVPHTAFDGNWHWSLVTEDEGVRRVENERWRLERGPDGLRGHYERAVTFLSTDGMPFSCNQGLSYTLRARYQLSGQVRAGELELREVDYTTPESPCDRGFRKLTRYHGAIEDGHLVLTWDGGRQTLQRIAARPAPPAARAPRTLTGSWRWTTRTPEASDGTARVEVETWTLDEDAAGGLAGIYERTVTVLREDGLAIACSGAPQYSYRDRYRVRGRRDGARVTIDELAVDPQPHPCLEQRDRHLDHATGALTDGYLILDWRGRRRQVLHRESPARSADGHRDHAAQR